MIFKLIQIINGFRSLMTHKYEVSVSGIRELEILKEQMENDHMEHRNVNNGLHYNSTSVEIV